jgi:hypothetical protein
VTPEPTVTPTPVPESGVKLTEFGYWITYPPLGPQKWSTNPPPNPNGGNIVYFDPTSGSIPNYGEADALGGSYDYIQTYVHRVGNMDGTVNVTIHATMSDNIDLISYLSSVSDYDYYFSMHTDYDRNMTEPNVNGDYVLTFGPGVSEQYLCLHINDARQYSVESPVPYEPSEGWVKLTITNADGGYSIGSHDEYMLNINNEEIEYPVPEVNFDYYEGYVSGDNSGFYHDSNGGVVDVDNDTDYVYAYVYLERDIGLPIPTTVTFTVTEASIPESAIYVAPYTFGPYDTFEMIPIRIDREYVYGESHQYAVISIEDSSDYDIDIYDSITIYMNYWW